MKQQKGNLSANYIKIYNSGIVSTQIIIVLPFLSLIMFVQMVFSLTFMRRESQATIGMLYDKLWNVRLMAI